MKNKILFLLLILIFSIENHETAAAESDLVKPGQGTFEDGGLGFWIGTVTGTLTNTTAQAHSGNRSLRIETQDYVGGYVNLTISDLLQTALIPGVSCTVKIWIRPDVAAGQVRIYNYTDGTNAAQSALSGSNLWQEHTLIFTPVAGKNYRIRFANLSGNTDPFVDDITVVQNGIDLVKPGQGTFEDGGLGFWVGKVASNISNTTEHAHSGTHSLLVKTYLNPVDWSPERAKLDLTTEGLLDRSLVPGVPCTVKIWIKAFFTYVDSNGNPYPYGDIRINDRMVENWVTFIVNSRFTKHDQWEEHILIFIPAAGIDYQMRFGNITGGSNPYIDDISVIQDLPPENDNLVKSGQDSFEDGGTGYWVGTTAGNISNTTEHAHTGSHSIRIETNDWKGGYVKLIPADLLETALIPGNPCTVTIWIRANLAAGQVRINSFNNTTAAQSDLTLSNQWQEHTLTFVPAAGNNYWIRFANISAATDPYVDDITVTQTFGKIKNDFSGTDTEMPSDFSLLGNFPNPFNPSTTISYALPFQSQVELKIYDIMGAEVKSFNIPSQSAGYQSVFWDGRNNYNETVSSGIYLYRLSLKSQENNEIFIKTAKLVMLK